MDHDGGLGARLQWLVEHHPAELAEILERTVPADVLHEAIARQVSNSASCSDVSARTRSPSTAQPR